MTDLLWQQLKLNVQLTFKVSLWLSSICFFTLQRAFSHLSQILMCYWVSNSIKATPDWRDWSARSLVICARAEASSSILLIRECWIVHELENRPSFYWSSQAIRLWPGWVRSAVFGTSKGCSVSVSCGSGDITKPRGTRLLFKHSLDPDLMPTCKIKDVLSPKSNLGDEFEWQLSAVLLSPGDNKSCLVRGGPDPQSVSSE